MKEKKLQIIFISLFMAILILPSVVWGAIKLFGGEKALTAVSVELDEKRDLAEFPKEFNPKKITVELESFYNDHLPFRSNIISYKNRIISSMEKAYVDKVQPILIKIFYPDAGGVLGGGEIEIPDRFEVLVKGEEGCEHLFSPRETEKEATCFEDGSYLNHCLICGYKIRGFVDKAHKKEIIKTVEPSYEGFGFTLYECKACSEQFKGDFKEKLIDKSYKPPRIFGGNVIEGRYGWLFYASDNSINYYRNSNVVPEATLREWTAVLEELQVLCDEKGIKLEVIVYPNKEQVYSEYMPTYEIIEGEKRTVLFAQYVSLNSSVNFTYALDDLTKNKLYYETYYKYDTHWNDVGAFLGVQAIYKDLGFETTDLLSLKIEEEAYNFGDLLVLGNLSSAVYNTDTKYTVHYRDEVEYSASGEFDTGTVRTVSDSGNGKKIVLIGDSFRNAMIKYLGKDFSEGVFTHRAKIKEVAADVRNTDVLVIEAVERYDYSTVTTAKTLIEFLKNS